MNFKDLFLETLEQDRYGLTGDTEDINETNNTNERVIYNTAKSYSMKEKRMNVALPNIHKKNSIEKGNKNNSKKNDDSPGKQHYYPETYYHEYQPESFVRYDQSTPRTLDLATEVQ